MNCPMAYRPEPEKEQKLLNPMKASKRKTKKSPVVAAVAAATASKESAAKKKEAAKTVALRKNANNRFGIQNNFPEYQKNSASPEDARDRGRVWVKGENGKLEPIFMVTGLTDGKYTEVIRSQLQSGTQIILGLNSQTVATQGTTNPLSGQGQRMGGPGGPGGPR